MTKIDVPDLLVPALLEVVDTFVAKGESYGHTASWDRMFAEQANHLGVAPREIADVFEMTKLARLREMRLAPSPREPLSEQYRDKAVFAILAFGLFLDSQESELKATAG